MSSLRIGIMGCLVNSTNLGCVALTYSLLQDLEQISKDINREFEYVIFDELPSEQAISKLCTNLSIEKSKVRLGTVGAMQTYNLKDVVRALTKKLFSNLKMRSDVLQCDVVIDMTGGDSFSDIYGRERFYKQTSAKRFVEYHKIPLILGPQTYGPYADPKVKDYARKTIEGAYLVMSRDDESKEYVGSFCHKDVVAVTDLAFGLAYTRQKVVSNDKVRIGINPSGLLGKNKVEQTKLSNELKTDYDAYINELIEILTQNSKYEIHLIPHVGNEAIECFPGFNNVIYHEAFSDPIEAKTLISTMDIFVGSRMHATIGAFSSGVPTIPVAYSKKFMGLFQALGYDYVVDMQTLETKEAVDMTLQYIDKIDELKQARKNADVLVRKKYGVLVQTLKSNLAEIKI